MKRFASKRVFISGGSSGIGKAAAELLARNGAHVCIAARGQEQLDAALTEVRAAASGDDQRFAAISVDVGEPGAVEAAAAKTIEQLGGIDVVIHSAGVVHPAAMLDTPDDAFEWMMRVNYLGAVHVSRAFLPTLLEQGSGQLAYVSSIVGFMGIYGYAGYAASKHAVVGFVECLRQELLDTGVGVSILYPPDTDTPGLRAENEIKPPETSAIAGQIRPVNADAVARALLKGIASRRPHIVPGGMGKLTRFLYRHAPWLVRGMTDGALRRYRRGAKRSVLQSGEQQ